MPYWALKIDAMHTRLLACFDIGAWGDAGVTTMNAKRRSCFDQERSDLRMEA
jgi:hypothetical protein